MSENFVQPEWGAMFAVNTPLVELAVRATVLYAVILVPMCLMSRRTRGRAGGHRPDFPAPDRGRGVERLRRIRPERGELALPFHRTAGVGAAHPGGPRRKTLEAQHAA